MLKCLSLFLFVAGAMTAQIDEEHRIFGGRTATVGQFPYQAWIRLNHTDFGFCNGAILSNRFILTAARCMQGKYSNPAKVFVIAGAHQIRYGGTQYAVNKIVNHPNFSENDLNNDISVVRTAHPINLAKHVRPIALPTVEFPDNVAATVSGWGKDRVSMMFDLHFDFDFLGHNKNSFDISGRLWFRFSRISIIFAIRKYNDIERK